VSTTPGGAGGAFFFAAAAPDFFAFGGVIVKLSLTTGTRIRRVPFAAAGVGGVAGRDAGVDVGCAAGSFGTASFGKPTVGTTRTGSFARVGAKDGVGSVRSRTTGSEYGSPNATRPKTAKNARSFRLCLLARLSRSNDAESASAAAV
jgi:hypothetical protein